MPQLQNAQPTSNLISKASDQPKSLNSQLGGKSRQTNSNRPRGKSPEQIGFKIPQTPVSGTADVSSTADGPHVIRDRGGPSDLLGRLDKTASELVIVLPGQRVVTGKGGKGGDIKTLIVPSKGGVETRVEISIGR